MQLPFENIFIQTINAGWLRDKKVSLDVLRLDVIDKTISGNKWFKLKYYIQDALQQGQTAIATFGGAYSNHIVATARACSVSGLQSIGIIRGEAPPVLSHTLQMAKEFDMQLIFVKRSDYKNFDKEMLPNVYWINEGGYGEKGMKGAGEIMDYVKNKDHYTHIVCAVGTGTTVAGLVRNAGANKKVIGISVMKNNESLLDEIRTLVNDDVDERFELKQDYHFGGYAKYNLSLIDMMNDTFSRHSLPLDFVYTGKTFYAIKDMIINKMILENSKVLMIHTGGLQGNLSLPRNALQF